MGTENYPHLTHEHTSQGAELPWAVDRLAADPAWNITRHTTSGHWVTAEWRDGDRWRIGLTPIDDDIVAAMLWSGDQLVDHARGTEAAMCATVHSWIQQLQCGGVPGTVSASRDRGPDHVHDREVVHDAVKEAQG